MVYLSLLKKKVIYAVTSADNEFFVNLVLSFFVNIKNAVVYKNMKIEEIIDKFWCTRFLYLIII